MDIKDIKDARNELVKSTGRGFGYFMKNVGMIVLTLVPLYIIVYPECLTDPRSYFSTFSTDSMYVLVAVFLALCGVFCLSRSINKDNKHEFANEAITDYERAFDSREQSRREHHLKRIEERFEAGPHISNELKNLLIKLGADKAAIIEMHNGTNNMADLPFVYGDMVYEEISPEVTYSSDEFKDVNLAKLPFIAAHYKDSTWIGSVDEIDAEDHYFAAKLKMSNVDFGSIVVLEGTHGPIGFLLVFFAKDSKHPSKSKIIAAINHSSQIISNLLDNTRE